MIALEVREVVGGDPGPSVMSVGAIAGTVEEGSELTVGSAIVTVSLPGKLGVALP